MVNTIQTILCPTDFSETAEHALRYAIDLAAKLGARIHVVHAFQVPVYAMPDGAVIAKPDYVAALTTEIQKQMDELIRRYGGHDVELKGHVVEGVAYEEINRLGGVLGAQMIVMGTHGRGGLAHLLLGSVAERVVRTATIPVLTVRKPS